METLRPKLDTGTIINTSDGQRYTVDRFLGRGGQGEVYRVNGPEGAFALKWYHADLFLNKINKEAFYKNIKNNVESGVPSLSTGDTANEFIWPEKLVDWQLGSFGYMMPLFKEGFYSISDIIMGRHIRSDGSEEQIRWKSWFVRLTAGINLVRAFEILHARGLSYQDVNEGGFAIDIENGNVMICDCDNVAPDLTNLGILGVLQYMAPEVICGKTRPNKHTDLHSLAVILFRFFFHNHPLEGENSVSLHSSEKMSRREADMRIYGSEPHYCLSCTDSINKPNVKLHQDVLKLCGVYPAPLLQAFDQVFTAGLTDPSARLTATEWRKVLLQTRDCLVHVNQKEEFFFTPQARELPESARTLVGKRGNVVLCMPQKILYDYHFNEYSSDYKTPVAKIIETKQPGVIGLYNGGDKTITAEWKEKTVECPPGGRIPLIPGMTLTVDRTVLTVE